VSFIVIFGTRSFPAVSVAFEVGGGEEIVVVGGADALRRRTIFDG